MALRGTLTHWKTRLLATQLQISAAHALGLLEALWHATAEDAPSGNIGRLSNSAIAMQMFTDINPDLLIAALIDSKHLDEHPAHRLIVHDWDAHADYNTKRKVARRNELIHTKSGDVTPSVKGHDASQPVTTGHDASRRPYPEPEPEPVPEPEPRPSSGLSLVDKPEPEEKTRKPTKQPSKIEQEFEEDWPKFWVRVAKKEAGKAYEKARKEVSREVLMAEVAKQGPRLLAEAHRKDITVVYPATWMNKGRWTDEDDAQPSLGFVPAVARGLTAKEISERG